MSEEPEEARPRIAVTHERAYNVDAYLEAVERAGGNAIDVMMETSEWPEGEISLAGFDGLLLCGGVDVDPALYGQERHAETEEPNPVRDALEEALLRDALENDRPVLAICRGLQLFNVAHGGTLIQHLDDQLGDARHVHRTANKAEPAHEVRMEPGTLLAGMFEKELVAVNSRHHQAVDRVGEGLQVSARSQEGIIEGLERRDKTFAVAVQWHPENMAAVDPAQFELFRKFIAAVGAAAR